MNSNLKISVFYFIALLIISVFIFPMWTAMLLVWIGAFVFIKHKKLDDRLNFKEKKLFTLIAYIYPFIETIIKYMVIKDVIPYSWHWLNRLEHLTFSLVIGLLLLPLIKPALNKLNLIEASIFFVGLVVILGNLNEFLEYAIRIIMGLTDEKKFSTYYWDTIYDLFINLIGAVIGFGVYKKLEVKSDR